MPSIISLYMLKGNTLHEVSKSEELIGLSHGKISWICAFCPITLLENCDTGS